MNHDKSSQGLEILIQLHHNGNFIEADYLHTYTTTPEFALSKTYCTTGINAIENLQNSLDN